MCRGYSHVTARTSGPPVSNALATPAFSPAYPAKPLDPDYCHPEFIFRIYRPNRNTRHDSAFAEHTPRLSVTRLQMRNNTVLGLPGHSFPWDFETSEQHPEQSSSPKKQRVDRLPVTTEQAVTRTKVLRTQVTRTRSIEPFPAPIFRGQYKSQPGFDRAYRTKIPRRRTPPNKRC